MFAVATALFKVFTRPSQELSELILKVFGPSLKLSLFPKQLPVMEQG